MGEKMNYLQKKEQFRQKLEAVIAERTGQQYNQVSEMNAHHDIIFVCYWAHKEEGMEKAVDLFYESLELIKEEV